MSLILLTRQRLLPVWVRDDEAEVCGLSHPGERGRGALATAEHIRTTGTTPLIRPSWLSVRARRFPPRRAHARQAGEEASRTITFHPLASPINAPGYKPEERPAASSRLIQRGGKDPNSTYVRRRVPAHMSRRALKHALHQNRNLTGAPGNASL